MKTLARINALITVLLVLFSAIAAADSLDPVANRFYSYKDQLRPWTERPPVPENSFWVIAYGHTGSDHEKGGLIQLQKNGSIRVWQGSADLNPKRLEVVPGEVNGRRTTVLPDADVEKVVYAQYTWGYDDHGILTFYTGKGERLKIAWKLFMISHNPDNDHLTFQAPIADRPGEMVGISLVETP